MIVVIRFLVWCVHFIAVTMPGKSRDGPPCTLQMFAGVKYKPDWSTVKMARRADVWNLFAVGQKNKRAAVVRLYPSWQAGKTEMSDIDQGGFVYPHIMYEYGNEVLVHGITLRQHYAGLAMKAIIALDGVNSTFAGDLADAKRAYRYADAMIEASKQ